MNIVVVLTCFNRMTKTKECIESLVKKNRKINFYFVIVDDKSTDGTYEMLLEMCEKYNLHVIRSNGNLYYSGSMRVGMDFILKECNLNYDYLLMINDDVEFFEESIQKMIVKSKKNNNTIIVGATQNKNGKLSYGAIKYQNGIKYMKIDITESNIKADTFNANCVLIPYEAFIKVKSIDCNYIHSLGDFDYGLSLKRFGYNIVSSDEYVGICENNTIKNTWRDSNLSILQRIRLKEHPKGAPLKQWFYYLKKNFGICTAIKGATTPYIRILLKK